jgi:diguanylate cyclase (GGDEF)-like protein/PAS domain S-box-containing protein
MLSAPLEQQIAGCPDMSRIQHAFDQASRKDAIDDNYPEWRFRATFDHAPVGMAHVSPEGRFLLVNDQFCEIAGHSRHALLTHGFQRITHPDDLETDLARVRKLLDGTTERYAMDKRYIRQDGSTVWVKLTVSLIRNARNEPDFFCAVIEDLSDIKRAQAEAILDPLTGLLNRRGLMERLEREIERSIDNHTPLGLIYLDLDDFKDINDTHGHPAGDACLLGTADALAAGARLESVAGRIGGDEFVMILPRTNREQLGNAVNRVQAAIEETCRRLEWNVTASIGGVTAQPSETTTPACLIKSADQAMFSAKRKGKNRCCLLAM